MDITRPKAPPGRVRRLNADEEKFLLLGAQSLRGSYMKHLIPFAVATAMRRGELVALDWRWVDWNDKRISIPADVTKNGKPRALPLYKTEARPPRPVGHQTFPFLSSHPCFDPPLPGFGLGTNDTKIGRETGERSRLAQGCVRGQKIARQ